MSSKFSNGAATQKKPAVCHTFPYPPVPFTPPLYPPLKAYCRFNLKNNAGDLISDQFTWLLKWYFVPKVWMNHSPPPDYSAYIDVRLGYPGPLVRFSIQISPPASPMYVLGWYHTIYTPGQPWESGEYFARGVDPENWIWSTFST